MMLKLFKKMWSKQQPQTKFCFAACVSVLTLLLPLGHRMAFQEECFPFDCLMSHDILLEVTLFVHFHFELYKYFNDDDYY